MAGAAHACVTTFDGAVLCWGANDKGQVGDGTFVNRTSPVTITFWLPYVSVLVEFFAN